MDIVIVLYGYKQANKFRKKHQIQSRRLDFYCPIQNAVAGIAYCQFNAVYLRTNVQ